ncbi:MAG: Do family serine endopeptidase [Chlamydiota bacterium]|jgi:serine protease Do
MQNIKKSFIVLAVITSFLSLQLQASNINGKKVLEETSQAFIQIGKSAVPAAVFIKSEIKQQNTAHFGQDPFDLFNDEFFKRFFGAPSVRPRSEPQPELSSGSGFIVSSQGHILTNFHVVKDAEAINVLLNDGREFKATLIGSDPKTDLAVLKIDAKDLPFLKFGDSDKLQIGEWVVAIGNPFALESTLTHGVVSAKGRQDLGITSLEDFIQTDAAINPGNSGGPLLNLEGDVIGINTAIVSRNGGYMGIGFAIPSNMAKHVLDQILDTGVVKRAYLGIMLQPLDKDLIDALSLDKNSEGILISEVMKDSPAEKGGLKHGDIIVGLNGKAVKNPNKFRNEIALMNPGTSVNLNILRTGKQKLLTVKLGTLSEQEIGSVEFFDKLGIDVDSLSNISADMLSKLGLEPHENGVLITKVKPGSPAAQAGLRPYYLVTALVVNWKNQIKINNSNDLTKALQEVAGNKYVVLIVRHQKYQKYYTLKIQ